MKIWYGAYQSDEIGVTIRMVKQWVPNIDVENPCELDCI